MLLERIYTYDEALEKSLSYFKGDELAANVWISKYALKDNFGNLLESSPEDMHRRLAKEFARIEAQYPNSLDENTIFNYLNRFKYIVPAGSPMAGIGNNKLIISIANCFVIPGGEDYYDSYGSIMKADEYLAQLYKRRAGAGTDLSHIRPKGAKVNNAAQGSEGVLPYMRRYSNTTREVAQSGRRGALMLTLSINHPDILDFVNAKLDLTEVTGANISVRVNDAFMKAVEADGDYILRYPVNSVVVDSLTEEELSKIPYNTLCETCDSEKNVLVYYKKIRAKDLFDTLVHNNRVSAEPGILFWDTIIREGMSDNYADVGFKTISTNPCGEITLSANSSCILLNLNLYGFVDKPFTPDASFNYKLFNQTVYDAMKLMDDMVTIEIQHVCSIIDKINSDPEPDDIKQTELYLWNQVLSQLQKGRRVGLGITAEGDMLAALGLRYGTTEASDFAENIHRLLATYSYASTIDMAEDRGCFPLFNLEKEKDSPFMQRIIDSMYKENLSQSVEKYQEYGRRNIACLTIPPTGSVSILTQSTSGIEPVFMPAYIRRRKISADSKEFDFQDQNGDKFEEYFVFHHKFKYWMELNGYDTSKQYSKEEIASIISKSPYHLATAMDLNWKEKVIMQGRVQKWIDHSISCTHNLPKGTTDEVIADLYMTAWLSGCKGSTLYVDGSRAGVLVDTSVSKKTPQSTNLKRPTILHADVIRFKNNKENWIAFVGLKDGHPYEIFTGIDDVESGIAIPKTITHGFITKKKSEDGTKSYNFICENKRGMKYQIDGLGTIFNPEFWNYAKFISSLLRNDVSTEQVIHVIERLNFKEDYINTWKQGIIRALKRYIEDGTKAAGRKCPNCGEETLIYQEGCLICTNCGNSKCG